MANRHLSQLARLNVAALATCSADERAADANSCELEAVDDPGKGARSAQHVVADLDRAQIAIDVDIPALVTRAANKRAADRRARHRAAAVDATRFLPRPSEHVVGDPDRAQVEAAGNLAALFSRTADD